MKIKLTTHIHYVKYSWDENGEYQIFSVQLEDTAYRTYVAAQEIEVDVPDNYDPTAQKIAALRKQQEKLQQDFTKATLDIYDHISKLQAIEYSGEEA